jgi:hypothetical protein
MYKLVQSVQRGLPDQVEHEMVQQSGGSRTKMIKHASLFKRRFKESFITQGPGFETNQKRFFLLPA